MNVDIVFFVDLCIYYYYFFFNRENKIKTSVLVKP